MIVEVTHEGVTLTDGDDFTSFAVRTGYLADLDEVLRWTGAGHESSGDAVISTEWVSKEAAASGIATSSWHTEYRAMLAFADSKGWMLNGGTGIKAHVELTTRERASGDRSGLAA